MIQSITMKPVSLQKGMLGGKSQPRFAGTQQNQEHRQVANIHGHKWPVAKMLGVALLPMVMTVIGQPVQQPLLAQTTVTRAKSEKESEGKVIEVTDKTFEKEVLQSDKLVVVKFGAPWCGPCRAIAPELEKLAKDPKYKDKIKVVDINVDENPETTKKYGITGIPDTFIFKKLKPEDKVNGPTEDDQTGYRSKDQLAKWVDKHLEAKDKDNQKK